METKQLQIAMLPLGPKIKYGHAPKLAIQKPKITQNLLNR